MAAPTIAIFDLPAFVSRNFNSMINGLCLNATNAGIKNALRKLERPIFDILARERKEVPDSRVFGATPMNAAKLFASFLGSGLES